MGHLHVQLIYFVQSALKTENLNDGWVTHDTSLQMCILFVLTPKVSLLR